MFIEILTGLIALVIRGFLYGIGFFLAAAVMYNWAIK